MQVVPLRLAARSMNAIAPDASSASSVHEQAQALRCFIDRGLLIGGQSPVEVIGQQDLEFVASNPAHTAALLKPPLPQRASQIGPPAVRISISQYLRVFAALPRSHDTPVLQGLAESPFPATPATVSAARIAASRWLRGQLACRRRAPVTAVVFSITGRRSSSDSVARSSLFLR